ncbi:MAG TPA: amidase family protein, partial [Anaerolineales bacterium]|nr:amidase family protein [Anaerolineales bacterium]
MDNLQSLTISAALEDLRGQKASPQDLTEACSRQIERLNPKLNAFITVIPPREALNAQSPGNNLPTSHALRGIPIALKDLFDTAGVRTTAGSKFFAEY